MEDPLSGLVGQSRISQSSASRSLCEASQPVSTFLSAVNIRTLPSASKVSPPTSDSITARSAGSCITFVGMPSPAGSRKRNIPFPFQPARRTRFPAFKAPTAYPMSGVLICLFGVSDAPPTANKTWEGNGGKVYWRGGVLSRRAST